MKNSQLIKLMKTFSPQEIKKFSEFISSPFFNKNKNVIKLYEVIKKAYPDFKQENLIRENLFNSIYPGRKFNDSTLRFLLHLLFESARKFIAYNRFEKDKHVYKDELTVELFERELYMESIKEIDKAISEIEEIDDIENFLYNYIFEYAKLRCIQRMKQEKFDKYITKYSIVEPFNKLTKYYFGKLLEFYDLTLHHKAIHNINVNTSLLEKLFSCFDYELFNDSPYIQIFYNKLMAFKTNDEKYFYTIKELVQKHEKTLIPIRLTDSYKTLQNICVNKILAGEEHFRWELFEIHKLFLDKQIYKIEQFLNHHLYRNILQNATIIKEFDWAENFLESYKNELRSDYREVVYYICKALLEAEKENFEKSLDYLSKLHTNEVQLKIDIKLLQARLYYELNSYDVLNSTIDSFRHFLKSNKFIPENKRLQLTTFIRLLSSLNNVKLKKDDINIIKLKDKIINTKYLQWKDWFVKKVEELKAT